MLFFANTIFFPRWEYIIPRLGMFCSQGGNKQFSLREDLAIIKSKR